MNKSKWKEGERDPPVGQGHAVEQAGQRGVDAQAPGAQRAVAVRLAPRPVHRVEVVSRGAAALPAARRGVAVRARHHEVPAVDHLAARERAGGQPGAEEHPDGSAVRL